MQPVITGMGVVSPLGNSVGTFWEALRAGADGIGPITRFDATDFPYQQGGEVHDFELPDGLRERGASAWDPATQLIVTAIDEAVADAGIRGDDAGTTGIVLSTNFGGIAAGEDLIAWVTGDGDARPNMLAEYDFLTAADHAARCWNWSGPRLTLSLSCSSSTAALVVGLQMLRAGRACRVIVGGYDVLSRFCWSGLGALRTMAKDRLRPFDKNRSGTLFSEGAGALVLEHPDAASARDAGAYARVLGGATTNNAHHMTAPAPEGRGSAEVMTAALQDAGLPPGAVDHINAHGTGTKYNDVTETKAIKAVFGAHAAAIPITSIKSMTGHLMGAAGAVEAIASVLSMRHGVIPPTINYEEPDPDCDLDYVTNTAREAVVTTALSNSAGIGGCNASIILSRGGTPEGGGA